MRSDVLIRPSVVLQLCVCTAFTLLQSDGLKHRSADSSVTRRHHLYRNTLVGTDTTFDAGHVHIWDPILEFHRCPEIHGLVQGLLNHVHIRPNNVGALCV